MLLDGKKTPLNRWFSCFFFLGHLTRGGNYRMFENFFDMPAMLMCARLIDLENDLVCELCSGSQNCL